MSAHISPLVRWDCLERDEQFHGAAQQTNHVHEHLTRHILFVVGNVFRATNKAQKAGMELGCALFFA